jgi:hypothetical protein
VRFDKPGYIDSRFSGLKTNLMIGSVLLEGVGDVTLTLEDFVTGEKIATRAIVCPMSNAGMVGALKNMQMVLQIVFSDAFENCLEVFIDNLEGIYRPMELVAADVLKHFAEILSSRVISEDVFYSAVLSDSPEMRRFFDGEY